MRLLVTRPEGDGERTAAALRTRGHDVLVAALLRIEAVPAADLGPGPFTAVLTTSANAARAIAGHRRASELRGLPLFTVGARSAEAARAAGFADVTSADGAADDLTALVARRFADARASLLYLAGEDRAADLVGALAPHGLTVRTVVVYRAVAVEQFPPAVAAAIAAGELDGALHYSPRSAAAFMDCAERARLSKAALHLKHYCLSAPVAVPLVTAGATTVRLASRPDEAALLELVGAD